MKSPIVFTLLTACKNEENDIRLSIESCLAQTYPHREILFVDDSTDRTKDIIRSYADRGVRLIDGLGHGCCMARNLGMLEAHGDVIVFLTADTRLEPNYLMRILTHYENGYDWVLVESQTFNLQSVYARFIEMQHRYDEARPRYNPTTSQGYSVRRGAALAVGMIDGGVYPFNTCRDWSLGKKLDERGYKKIFDRSIVVPHKSPATFREYWIVRKTRGCFAAYQPYYLFSRSLREIAFKFIVKDIFVALNFVLLIPFVMRVFAIARQSSRPYADFFPFAFAHAIQLIARCVGEWEGLSNIMRKKYMVR